MINIALVSHTAAFAGAERMLYNLARLLHSDDMFRPIVFLPGGPETESHLKEACDDAGIPSTWIEGCGGYLTWYIYDGSCGADPEKSRATIETVQTLEKIFLRDNIGMVVCNTATSLAPVLAGAALDIPVVTWIHGILDNTFMQQECNAQQRLLKDRVLLALSAQSICCSEWTNRFYEGVAINPIQAIHNWTPKEDIEQTTQKKRTGHFDHESVREKANKEEPKNEFRFVCLNSFEEHKGIRTLLEAARILVEEKKHTTFFLDLYGSGSREFTQDMSAFLQKNDLTKQVFLHERTNNIGKVYQGCNCLVQPSKLEPFGMTLIEAMAYSRPVIATRSGGPEEIVLDGETGFLIGRDDAEALADKMAFFIEHPGVAAEMGCVGRERYQVYFSEETAKKTMIPLLKNVYARYSGLSGEQKLFLDLMMHQLAAEAGNVYPPAENGPLMIPYVPEELCFSGILKKARRYGLSGQEGTITKVGLLFANMKGSLQEGTLTLKIYQRGKLLGASSHTGLELNLNGWTCFKFLPIHIETGIVIVEICPEGFEGLGVFEIHAKRGFLYKVSHKLGFPFKGHDVLKAVLLP